jgi:hypothetical protein
MLLLLALMIPNGFNWVSLVGPLILAGCAVVFATLTVRVDEAALEFWFGPGLIRRRFPLYSIAMCRVVKNPWYYGWGIHLTPAGWLYNVSGFWAVELVMTDGKQCRIGTDDPQSLVQAIENQGQLLEPPGLSDQNRKA